MTPVGRAPADFTQPAGEPALVHANSVAWQVFRNPLSLFVGGVAAVLLELAEPRVRAGVWDHSSFRTDAVDRLRRTGLAAMITVYGAQSVAEEMIAGVRRIHDRVAGQTPGGEHYRANDPELLDWVQATATFGFLEAYAAFVRPLTSGQRDAYYAEALPAARLYGALGAPPSQAELQALFDRMRARLGPSDELFQFLQIIRKAPILPLPLRPVQRLLVRAAVDILPLWSRKSIGLWPACGLGSAERILVRRMGAIADRLRLDNSPAAQASLRLGLPRDYLWKAAATSPSIRSSSPS